MTYQSAVLADSPWGYYRYADQADGATTSTLADSSGNARSLTLTGTAAVASAASGLSAGGRSLAFTTSSGYYASAGAAQPTSATYEAWVNVPTAGPATLLPVCGFFGDTSTYGPTSIMCVTAAGKIEFNAYNGGDRTITSPSSLTRDVWHHVVCSVGAAGMKIRIDGTTVATSATTSVSTFATGPFAINAAPWPGKGTTKGPIQIGDVSVWRSQLTDAQTDAHYAAGTAAAVPAVAGAATSVGAAAAAVLAVAIAVGMATSAGATAADVVPVGVATAEAATSGAATAVVEVVEAAPARTGTATSAGTASADVVPVVALTGEATGTGTASAAIETDGVAALATSAGAATAVVLVTPSTSVGPERGRSRTGTGVARWSPPVAPPPATVAPTHARIAAHAYSGVTMRTTAGAVRPVLQGRLTAERRRHRDRIVIAGRDVTFYRGIPTPLPKFGLVEPLLYGSGTLELPQVAAAFETPGRGALTWLRPGAEVLVQRVAVGGSQAGKVVATDYRGIVLGFGANGSALTVDLGGDALGRASLRDKPQPLFRRRRDLGYWWWSALSGTDSLRRRFDKVGGTRTGILLYETGGSGYSDYLSELAGKGVSTRGAQWTCMPAEAGDRAGIYRVYRKDTTTIHATAYLDDAHTVAALQADVSEQPNRVYGTGVTPTGERAKFGVYPMLAITGAAPFPNDASGQPMRRGDTDADTDSGGGISALLYRLSVTGYLDIRGLTGGFSANAARAVRDLQDDAHLPLTGRVDRATWAALYDHDVVGYSAKGARIEPIAQLPQVRRLRRNASGQVIGVNRNFDPTALVVDRTLDFGTGVTRAQMRDWARDELHATRHWTGTITIHIGGIIRGEHAPGDPLGANDLMHARSLRPGQNLWLPLWDGGTLLHISGVDVDVDSVTLAVDTRARDTMTVWEVIARNRENKHSPWRAWARDNRSSSMTKDAVLEFDEVGGVITDTALSAGWNVFPVVAGQEGTIGRLRMALDRPAEYVVAAFGKRVGSGYLGQVIGDPLSHEGAKRWADQDLLDKLVGGYGLVYSAGDDQAPCGYYPGTRETRTYTPQVPNPDYNVDVSPESDKFDNRETLNEQIPNPAYNPADPDNDQEFIDRVVTEEVTAPTGRWQDDAGFGYRTYDGCVLWVAVYVRRPRTLLGGRIMWPQLEAGA